MLGHVLAILWAAPPEGEVVAPAPTEVVAPETPVAVVPSAAQVPVETPSTPAPAPVSVAHGSSSGSSSSLSSEPVMRVYVGGIGVDGTARWGRRGEQPRTLLLAGLQARLVGYFANKPRLGGGRRFVTPDLRLSVELGESVSPRSRLLGVQGALQIGIGRSLATRVSPYGRLQADTRFAAYLHDIAEGNSISATLRGSAGLIGQRRDGSLALLAGATLDGVAGALRLGPRSTFAQVMNGAELLLVARPKDELAVLLGGEVRMTRLGERTGGRRVEGRASLELAFSGVSFYLWYTGTRIEADLPLGDGARFYELRRGHALQLGLSFGL